MHPDKEKRTWTHLQHAVYFIEEEEKEPEEVTNKYQAPESIERNKATNSSVNATTASNLLHG